MRANGFAIGAQEQVGIPEAVNPEQRAQQDAMLLQAGVKLSKDYLEKTYDVEIDEPAEDNLDKEKLVLALKKKAVTSRKR